MMKTGHQFHLPRNLRSACAAHTQLQRSDPVCKLIRTIRSDGVRRRLQCGFAMASLTVDIVDPLRAR